MDILYYEKQLQKREVLSYGGKVFFNNILSMIVIISIFSVLSLLYTNIINSIFINITYTMELKYFFIFYVVVIIGIIYNSFLFLVIIYLTHYSLNGKSITYKLVLQSAFNKWGIAIYTTLLATLILVALSFLLIIPAIIWTIFYTFTLQFIALTNLKGMKALNYSKNIVKTRFVDVLFFNAIFIAPIISIDLFLSQVFNGSYHITILSRILTSAIVVYFYVCLTIYFINLNKIEKSKETQKITP